MILFNDETGLIVFWVNLKIKKFKILKLKKIDTVVFIQFSKSIKKINIF